MSYADHAPLAPSFAPVWMECAGAPMMSAKYPKADDPKAQEGVIAHAVVAARMTGADCPLHWTDEMLEGADMFEDEVYSQVIRGTPLQVEAKVSALAVHPQNWGTPDLYTVDKFTKTLRVWDYKFGHRYVTAVGNWQLIDYAIAVMAELGPTVQTRDQWAEWTIRLCIVQPRSFHPEGPVRSWSIKGDELMDMRAQMASQAYIAMGANPPLRTNYNCIDCGARHACPALSKVTYSILDLTGESIPFDMTDDMLGRELTLVTTAIERLKAREAGLNSEALVKSKMGVNVPGWMITQGTGRKRWARPIDEVVQLGAMMGIDVAKPDVITPAQAIKAGLDAGLVAAYTETPTGEMKLVPVTKTTRIAFK